MSVRTIQRWLAFGGFPKEMRRGKRKSQFDRFAAHVLSRWTDGERNGARLLKEIRSQGFTGSERMFYRFLVPLRNKQRIALPAASNGQPLQDFSAKDAVWLFASAAEKLTPVIICARNYQRSRSPM